MNTNSAAPIPAGWKAKEAAAITKRDRQTVDPDVRAARAKMMAERDAIFGAQATEASQARTRPMAAFREAMASVPDDALADLARYVGSLNGRDMASAAGEILGDRIRARTAEPHSKPARVR